MHIYKTMTAIATATCLLSLSVSQVNATPRTRTSGVAVSSAVATTEVLRELRRLYAPFPFDHKSATYLDPRYQDERSLGFVSTAAFTGSHPIYQCYQSGPDYFTSRDANCEGKFRGDPYGYSPYITGWVSTTQVENTFPLYRCRANRNHFDSLMASCEGFINEGIMGYVFL